MGGIVSGILGGGSKSSGSSTTTTTNTPWSGQQPYLTDLFSKAQAAYNAGQLAPNASTQSYVAPLSSETEKALQLQTQRALAGSPLVDTTQSELQKTVGGEYLTGSNPYFAQMASDISRQVIPQVASQFAGSGRYGSGMSNRATADALAAKIGDLAYKNYGDERTRQLQASALAPTLANVDYTDLSQLAAAGTARENLAQQLLSEQEKNYLTEQNKIATALGNYSGLIQGNYGGNQTVTSPLTRANPLGSALGGAATGAGLASLLGQSTGWGAGIGGLLGLFG